MQKENYRSSNISRCKNKIFKKSSMRNQNPSRYYNSIIINLKFQHKPKYHLSKILIQNQTYYYLSYYNSIMNLNTTSLPWQARPKKMLKFHLLHFIVELCTKAAGETLQFVGCSQEGLLVHAKNSGSQFQGQNFHATNEKSVPSRSEGPPFSFFLWVERQY